MSNNHNNSGEDNDPQHWKNWFTTGDVIQMLIIGALVIASYVKSQANIDDGAKQVAAQGILLSQLHESVDQLRTSRQMTPEAAVRVTSLETRVSELESRLASLDARLQRIEDKIDEMRKELRH